MNGPDVGVLISPVARGIIVGLGVLDYRLAINAVYQVSRQQR